MVKVDDIIVRFTSPYACFTMPGTQAEPYSADFPTPSAVVGWLLCIFGKPQLTYDVSEIAVEKPIRRTTIRSNGTVKPSPNILEKPLMTSDPRNRVIRTVTALCDVSYVVRARVCVLIDRVDTNRRHEINERTFYTQFMRRAKDKECFKGMHLGVKGTEAMTRFEVLESFTQACPIQRSGTYGYTFYGREYSEECVQGSNVRASVERNLFYPAIMSNGVIAIPPRNSPSIVSQPFIPY